MGVPFAPIVKQVTFGDWGLPRQVPQHFWALPGVLFWTRQGSIKVSVGFSNFGLTSSRANHGCSVFARLFYRMAFSLINYQCQNGRAYPSRFSLKMLQYSADHGHVQAMAQLGGMLYRCGVGRADKRSGLEYLRRAAKGGDIDSQYLLGAAHMDGQLVRRDDKTAIHWLALAADQGHCDATRLLKECKTRQDQVEPAEQIPV